MSGGWLAAAVTVVTAVVMLGARITSVLVASLVSANRELSYVTLHDTLTGLPNRALLEDHLRHAMRCAVEEKSTLAFLFMGIDNFKGINDAFGHHAGALLLVEIFRRIESRVATADTLARLGADEFALVKRVADSTEAGAFADSMLKIFKPPVRVAGHELKTTASIGIAICPGDGEDADPLMTNAAAAMYHDSQLVSRVGAAVERHGLCAASLTFEVIESAAMQDVEASIRVSGNRGPWACASPLTTLARVTRVCCTCGDCLLRN